MKNLKRVLTVAVFATGCFAGNIMAWDSEKNEVVNEYSLDFINNRVYFNSVSGKEYNYKWSSSEMDARANAFLSVFMAAKATGSKVTVYYNGGNPYVPNSTTRWNLEQIIVK